MTICWCLEYFSYQNTQINNKTKEIDNLLESKDIENMICLKEKQKMNSEDEKPKHKIRAKVEHRFADL